jgi:hypothetical protein
MILGGNDIEDGCQPKDIVRSILSIVQDMKDAGIKRVFVSSIVERGSFLPRTRMNKLRFNQIRRSINKHLRKELKEDFKDIATDLKYPRHYNRDLIHPGWEENGLYVLKSYIHRTFMKTYGS